MIGWVDFIAGWVAGIAGLVVGHPWDTIKVRQQILHTSLFDAAQRTMKYEGVRGLYKGMLSPVLMTGPSNAVFFGVYGNCMRIIQGNYEGTRILLDDPNWKFHVFWAGCFAGSAQVLVTAPMELVKIMLQMQTNNKSAWKANYEPEYKGIWDCVRHAYKARGIRGMYRGASPMMFRDIPTSGLYTLGYEVMLGYKYPVDAFNISIVKQTMAGGMAGILSWIFVVPFDVVKSRLQADDPLNPKYKGMIDCFYKSYKADGMQIFMKGTLAVTVRAFPSNAAIFVVYEYMLDVLNNLRKNITW